MPEILPIRRKTLSNQSMNLRLAEKLRLVTTRISYNTIVLRSILMYVPTNKVKLKYPEKIIKCVLYSMKLTFLHLKSYSEVINFFLIHCFNENKTYDLKHCERSRSPYKILLPLDAAS